MTTFVVRLQPLDPSSAPTLRGVVDEIATGVTRTFTSTAELLDILLAALRVESQRVEGPRAEGPRAERGTR